jgi:hypothetical protein
MYMLGYDSDPDEGPASQEEEDELQQNNGHKLNPMLL